MELKPGYKQTEVGVIPEDWEVVKLRDLCHSITDGTHFTPRYVDQGIPFYSVENVTAGNFSDTKFISREEHALLIKRCKPERGDILLTRIGSLGETKLLDWDANASIYVSLALLKLSKAIEPDYVYRYSQSPQFIIDVEKRSLINATPKKINMSDIGEIPIPYPPSTIEQHSIATALSDVDALLAKLDALIAKKRDLKQVAMQQLLTGKQRLPGFSGEWEIKRLGDLFQLLSIANNARSDLSEYGEVGYIHYGDIHTGASSFLDCTTGRIPHIAQEKVKNLPLLENGDLVMVDASEDYQGIGKSVEITNVSNHKIVAGLHTFLLRGNKELITDGFKGYLQYIPAVQTAMIRLATGISVYGISKDNVRSIEVLLPGTKEQRAITTVLSDMDAEIAALEARRAKTQALKQGMMQELLTGRIRLI